MTPIIRRSNSTGHVLGNENFVLAIFGYVTTLRSVGCVAPFDAPSLADRLVR